MTRKHFEALAAEMWATRPPVEAIARPQWRRDVEGLADVCARFNPHFDRARFLKACGVEESK
jgi:hypothetical protein